MGNENPFHYLENLDGIEVDPTSSKTPESNVTDYFARKVVFDKPPASVRDEVTSDSIVDEWEQSASCQNLREQPD